MSEPTLQDRFHLIGIGGAGMSVVAELLASRGATVEGSDREDSAVLEHLRFLGATWGLDSQQALVEGRDLLSRLHLEGLSERYPHELSSGQSQLVAIALTLARPGRVLLLDEPEQRLDPDRLGLVLGLLRDRAEQGTAILLATHARRVVDELADLEIAVEGPT